MKNALIVGGTKGIGAKTSEFLSNGVTPSLEKWNTIAWGRSTYDVQSPSNLAYYNIRTASRELGGFDAFIYCAGDLSIRGLNALRFATEFYEICDTHGPTIFNNDCTIIAVSSVAAIRPAKLNPYYASAKAALESFTRTIADTPVAKRKSWNVFFHRFDLVATDMMKSIPADQRIGRDIISVEEAARQLISYVVPMYSTPKYITKETL